MKNPNPINLQTSEELREKGWQAESRDANGHLISCHAPIEADDPGIAEWIVECTRNGETVTFWPADASAPTPQKHLRVTGFRGNPLRVVLSNGDQAIISQKLIDSFASPSPFEQHPDDVAVDRFAVAMKAKLAEKRADGAGGWDDPEVCHIDYLAHLLKEQIHSRAALDLVDIGNFAMMIFNRGETPSHGR